MERATTVLASNFRTCRDIQIFTNPPLGSHYSTLEHGKAAYLLYQGHRIIFVIENAKIVFYFPDCDQLRSDLRDYENQNAKVDPREFYAIIKEVRQRLNDAKGKGGGYESVK